MTIEVPPGARGDRPWWPSYPPDRYQLWIGYAYPDGKRLVDIDDALLNGVQRVRGTDTIKKNVNAALRRLVDDETVFRHIERLRGSGALDLAKVEEARRPRVIQAVP